MSLGQLAASLWQSISPTLTTKVKIVSSEIPGLLSGMGVVNTVAVFAYSTVLGRVSGVRHRRWVASAFFFSWAAVLLVVLGYVGHSYFDAETGILVDAGLLVWITSFAFALLLIFRGARDVVGNGAKRIERFERFRPWSIERRFGVPMLDTVLPLVLQERGHVNFPFLLVHDLHSPGIRFAGKYIREGLLAGEGAVYLTFSRPHSVVRKQLGLAAQQARGLWIIDCYSTVYMPEETKTSGRRMLHADPRDPTDVYRKYMTALVACRFDFDTVRVVYETLTDFLKIADARLVMNFLRRVIVLEEHRNISAIYVFWRDAVTHEADASYLQWFFSAKLEIAMAKPMGIPATFQSTFTRFFRNPVIVETGQDFGVYESDMFGVRPARAETLGRAMRNLSFKPKPYDFLSSITDGSRARHLVNFLFLMAAIDHDTHLPGQKYEDTLGGRLLHGSDLLYGLAERAKQVDENLFLPQTFAAVSDATIGAIFTSPAGKLPADIEGRAEIIRACSKALVSRYGGDAVAMLDQSKQRLAGKDGLIARLRTIEAFSDPVGKKTALLIKLLVREDLFKPVDEDQISVAVDHVVMTMALRSGLIFTEDASIKTLVETGGHLNELQMGILRNVTNNAMGLLTRISGLPPDEIDDLLWSYGRMSLRQDTPLKSREAVHSALDAQIDVKELANFVAILNGVDCDSALVWPSARTVRGPFTRFY